MDAIFLRGEGGGVLSQFHSMAMNVLFEGLNVMNYSVMIDSTTCSVCVGGGGGGGVPIGPPS